MRYPLIVSQCLRGVMTKVLDYDVEVNEFEIQWHYYVHSRTNILGKVINLLIPAAKG